MSDEFADKYSQHGHRLVIDDDVVDDLVNRYKVQMEEFGARGIADAIHEAVIVLLARPLLSVEHEGATNVEFVVRVADTRLRVEIVQN